jgi:hypothetical protein
MSETRKGSFAKLYEIQNNKQESGRVGESNIVSHSPAYGRQITHPEIAAQSPGLPIIQSPSLPVEQSTVKENIISESPSHKFNTDSPSQEYNYPSRFGKVRVQGRLEDNKKRSIMAYLIGHNMTIESLIERLLVDWASGRVVDLATGRLADWAAHDESDDKLLIDDKYLSIMDSTERDIYEFYKQETGNRVKKSDVEFYRAKLNTFNPVVVKTAILMGLLRTKKKINSLNFFYEIVKEIADAPMQSPQDYFSYVRKKLEQKRREVRS